MVDWLLLGDMVDWLLLIGGCGLVALAFFGKRAPLNIRILVGCAGLLVGLAALLRMVRG